MSGFVGSRARRKKRNIFFILIVGFFALVIYFFSPSLEISNNEIVPNDNIIPLPTENVSSLASNIEELEISIFQKEQKIKFRDGQIKNLQNQLKDLQIKNDAIILELTNSKNDYEILFSDNKKLVPSNQYKTLQDNYSNLDSLQS